MENSKRNIFVFGGDGYVGWTLGLAFANRTNFNVILADNLIKRQWEKEVHAKSLVPINTPKKRISEYKRIFGKSNLEFLKIDLLNYSEIAEAIKKFRPAIIINAAQQPSAPFSMMSPKNAAATFNNNIVGHLNALWAIAETDKSIKYIKLGSAGCYSGIDTGYVPLKKTDFQFVYNGRSQNIFKSWLPMYATDFYHQSKISDFLISELGSDIWNLKIATVQQSTIFGATILENHPEEHSALSARFDYDAVFGTVINRFACQLAIGEPLTIYGEGGQGTGLISLSDTVENFINITETDLPPGEHKVIHNYTLRLSINEIADSLLKIAGEKPISHIENPRKETAVRLRREIETHRAVENSHKNKEEKFKKELSNLIDFINRYKKNINKSVIIPKVLWKK